MRLVEHGRPAGRALEMGITNKAFDPFERQLVYDVISARVSPSLTRSEMFS